jgi:hypothetical protein
LAFACTFTLLLLDNAAAAKQDVGAVSGQQRL